MWSDGEFIYEFISCANSDAFRKGIIYSHNELKNFEGLSTIMNHYIILHIGVLFTGRRMEDAAPFCPFRHLHFVTIFTVRTFDEAMELAYFGGQVLHPSAMVPCIEERIPVLVKCLGSGGSTGGERRGELLGGYKAGDFRRFFPLYSKKST